MEHEFTAIFMQTSPYCRDQEDGRGGASSIDAKRYECANIKGNKCFEFTPTSFVCDDQRTTGMSCGE